MKKIITKSDDGVINVDSISLNQTNSIIVKNSNNILIGIVDSTPFKGYSLIKKDGSKTEYFSSLRCLIEYFSASYTFHLLD